MSSRAITIELDSLTYDVLAKRAKKQLVSVSGLVQDIVRRSMVSYTRTGSSASTRKVDDTFVELFSRARSGRKRKI